MILPGFSSDGSNSPNGPNNPKTSSGLVGVLCGMLFLFLLLVASFLSWGRVYPFLQMFTKWLGEKVQKAKQRLWPGRPQTVVLPPPESPRTADEALLPLPPPFDGRHHGPDSVDTLPRYTPSDRPSTPPMSEYSRSISGTG